jgi:hypothetical protein
MEYSEIVTAVADILKALDSERPVHKNFQPGIGPFGEPQIVKIIAERLTAKGIPAQTKRTPDLDINHEWALEFKIVRPFGDNGKEAENWSVNILHPYSGNVSLLGDAMKLSVLKDFPHKGLFVIGYEHNPARISLNPLFDSFELIARDVVRVALGGRVEESHSFILNIRFCGVLVGS